MSLYLFEVEDKQNSICNFMEMNKSYFICLVDRPFVSHLSKQGELNGSVDLWKKRGGDSCRISIIWSECQNKDLE